MDEEISLYCPDMKEFKMVDLNGQNKTVDYLLLNLKEAHNLFQQKILV